MKTLHVDDQTYTRLASLLDEMMSEKKRDIDMDHVINELIDTYQDSRAFSGENAGG